jgi:dipeptidyl aminopeptidase/acylaminoacyl peptidase
MARSCLLAFLIAASLCGAAETNIVDPRLERSQDKLNHVDASLTRQLNELLWMQRLSDVAIVDKVRFTGPPPATTNGPAPAGSNEVIVSALTFMPRGARPKQTLPLLVFVHGEIHGNVAADEDAQVVREMVQQGYAVIAPDYRGSSGYGADFWRKIDYGGLEIEDVQAAREWMLQRHRQIDPHRVGIAGWSHGGAIALLTVFAHPDDYQACYAGVPVSDLAERIRIRGKDYEQLFAAPYHIGKTVAEAPGEYQRRSPVTHVDKLRTPLLLHANTNDEDVTLEEISKLLAAFNASGKQFQYQIYTNAPGGHLFNRIDTPLALRSRDEVWNFLARYLKPPRALPPR